MRNLDWLQPLASMFSSDAIHRIRRNHGLEHATVTVLSEKFKDLRLSGRATAKGFFVYGKVNTEDLTAAVHEALQRLKNGEARLAVHPNCGTNLVTKGLVAGLAAYWALSSANSAQSMRRRLPQVMLASTAAVIAGQPLGGFLQKHVTTSAEMGSLRVIDVQRSEQGRFVKHFISTTE